ALLVADATGHGIPAALSTALLKFAFSQFQHRTVDATGIVEGMNRVLYRGLPADTFVACAVTVMDPRSAECRIVNAGLPHPYHIQPSKATARPVVTEGFMLGVVENDMYEPAKEVTVPLRNGDTLLFYTDGLSEAENSDGEQFDEKKLGQILAAQTGEPCEKLFNALMHASKEFSRPDHNWDDVTIVGVSLNC
ncbi:MAG: PP2C family protein-serine/threonine phosphatase, partial [bacterium]